MRAIGAVQAGAPRFSLTIGFVWSVVVVVFVVDVCDVFVIVVGAGVVALRHTRTEPRRCAVQPIVLRNRRKAAPRNDCISPHGTARAQVANKAASRQTNKEWSFPESELVSNPFLGYAQGVCPMRKLPVRYLT